MKRVYYNKLIRDGIQGKIQAAGEHCEVRTIVDDAEFEQELLKKVAEEASALSQVRSRAEFLSEYADLMMVLDALTAHMELSEADIQVAMKENIAKKGWYKEKLFLHWSEDAGYTSNETPQGIKS